jgi:hypothetical protein
MAPGLILRVACAVLLIGAGNTLANVFYWRAIHPKLDSLHSVPTQWWLQLYALPVATAVTAGLLVRARSEWSHFAVGLILALVLQQIVTAILPLPGSGSISLVPPGENGVTAIVLGLPLWGLLMGVGAAVRPLVNRMASTHT